MVTLAEGNHSVLFNRSIGESLEPFLREKNFFFHVPRRNPGLEIVVVVVGVVVARDFIKA